MQPRAGAPNPVMSLSLPEKTRCARRSGRPRRRRRVRRLLRRVPKRSWSFPFVRPSSWATTTSVRSAGARGRRGRRDTRCQDRPVWRSRARGGCGFRAPGRRCALWQVAERPAWPGRFGGRPRRRTGRARLPQQRGDRGHGRRGRGAPRRTGTVAPGLGRWHLGRSGVRGRMERGQRAAVAGEPLSAVTGGRLSPFWSTTRQVER